MVADMQFQLIRIYLESAVAHMIKMGKKLVLEMELHAIAAPVLLIIKKDFVKLVRKQEILVIPIIVDLTQQVQLMQT